VSTIDRADLPVIEGTPSSIALYMLACSRYAEGTYPVLGGDFGMRVAKDFNAPYRRGFAPSPRLYRAAIRRAVDIGGHMAIGDYLLNGSLLDIVEHCYPRVAWALGTEMHRSNEGPLCHCAYGFDGTKLVAMLAPMQGGS